MQGAPSSRHPRPDGLDAAVPPLGSDPSVETRAGPCPQHPSPTLALATDGERRGTVDTRHQQDAPASRLGVRPLKPLWLKGWAPAHPPRHFVPSFSLG